MCWERFLRVVVFEEGRANCIHTIFCGEIVRDVYCFDSLMVAVMQRGLFEVCTVEPVPGFWPNL